MMTYVKYFYSSEFEARYIYGYISGYVNDKDGTPLVVIVITDVTNERNNDKLKQEDKKHI